MDIISDKTTLMFSWGEGGGGGGHIQERICVLRKMPNYFLSVTHFRRSNSAISNFCLPYQWWSTLKGREIARLWVRSFLFGQTSFWNVIVFQASKLKVMKVISALCKMAKLYIYIYISIHLKSVYTLRLLSIRPNSRLRLSIFSFTEKAILNSK